MCAALSFLTLAVSAVPGATLGEETVTVRVGYTQFPPFSRTAPSGVTEGYSIDLIRMLLEPRGFTPVFLPFNNPAEMLAAMQAGEIDLTTILADNPARREVGTFTEFVGQLDVRVFVASGTPLPETIDDLRGLRISAAEGSIGYRMISEVEGISLVPASSGINLLLPLLSGEVDAVVNSVESLRHVANKSGLSHRIAMTNIVLRETPVALLVEPSETALVSTLNTAILEARTDGSLTRLYNQWFASRLAPFTLREQYVLAAALAVILAAIAYWARLHYIVLKRAQRMEARSQLFGDALDATGQSLIIFDEDMRPIHWNDSFKRCYPKQVPLVQRGATIEELVQKAWMNGSMGKRCNEEEAAEVARERVELLRAGGDYMTVHRGLNDTFLRRKTMMLPNGYYVSIAADVTELIQSQSKLEDARDELETANQKLGEFNRLAAHDLMAPLRNVRNLHNWIRDDLEDMGIDFDEETIRNLESIDTLLTRQSRMIEDLLAFSTTESSQTPEEFNPKDRYEAILDLANVSDGFKVHFPPETPLVYANPVAFDIVLRNLISNAIKHHDKDQGRITVTAETTDSRCVFEVRDDGPGIPEAALDKVFEPFTRLKSRDDGAGSGLGLAFIKRRVTEWGGSVRAISRDGERGVTFRFDVPLARPGYINHVAKPRVRSRPRDHSSTSSTKSA